MAMNATITVSDASLHPFSEVVLKELKVQTTGAHPDGFAVPARLAEGGIRLPVIIITGCDLDTSRDRALAGGASAYLHKPASAANLLAAIAAAIAPA
jgi:DNA-binding response OmpR family regulator